jgi:hypothetical protein
MIGTLVAWFLLDLAIEILGEILLGFTHLMSQQDMPRPVAVAWFLALGTGLGAASTLVFGTRLMPPGPFLGVSLLLVPILLGATMEYVGRARASEAHAVSHLASWYGGGAMGLGLASGRLGMLLLLKTV